MNVSVPESYRDFINDKVINSVVEHLLELPDTDLPVDEWDEVPAYYQSWLSAQKVKTDYALFLFDLWDAVWKPALEVAGIGDELSIDEVRRISKSHRPTREDIWQDGLNRLFRTRYQGRNVLLQTWIGDDGVNGAHILAALYDADSKEEITEQIISSLLAVSDRWQEELDDDDFCRLKDGSCLILHKDSLALDVSPLKLAAQDLLKIIG